MADEAKVIDKVVDEWSDGRLRYAVVDCADNWPQLAYRSINGNLEFVAEVSPVIVRRLVALLAERRQESEPAPPKPEGGR